jgi:hypothetical protein
MCLFKWYPDSNSRADYDFGNGIAKVPIVYDINVYATHNIRAHVRDLLRTRRSKSVGSWWRGSRAVVYSVEYIE